MNTIDKASKSAHKAFDKLSDATSQAAESLGEIGGGLKKA